MHKKILSLILMFALLTTPLSYARADIWGSNYVSAGLKQMLEEIFTEIQNAIYAAAKMEAIKQATSTIEDSLYGGDSSPRNIKNFNEFLLEDPQDKAVTYAEDFLTSTLRGTTSGDYTSSGSGGGLESAIESAGKSVIKSWEGKNESSVDLADYCSDTSDVFADENWDCFASIWNNPLNTPIGMALAVDRTTAAKYQQEKEVATLMATSTGTLPQVDEEGDVSLPNSLVEEIQKQQVTLPLEALANGDNDAFSSMIQSFAVSLITSIVEDGLSEMDESMDKNSESTDDQLDEDLDGYDDTTNPYSDDYDDTMKQDSTNSWQNPDTGQAW